MARLLSYLGAVESSLLS